MGTGLLLNEPGAKWPGWLRALVIIPHGLLGFIAQVALVAKDGQATAQLRIRRRLSARLLSDSDGRYDTRSGGLAPCVIQLSCPS
jgi:hypothetical protein